ncbi:MAG TPA: type II toxin-antitoxin system RelE/ParE family toxin [Caulobacteraceae bacterium]|nr:type II toxin-antitoxin system RelE/ParE family toxin [Caulobacteraceae bacterium]
MRVIFTGEAEADLEEIADTTAMDSPRRALTFVQELRRSCDGLGDNPRRFEVVERFKAYGVRRRVHGSYLIFYMIEDGAVAVMRIIHGARDYESLLTSDGWFG